VNVSGEVCPSLHCCPNPPRNWLNMFWNCPWKKRLCVGACPNWSSNEKYAASGTAASISCGSRNDGSWNCDPRSCDCSGAITFSYTPHVAGLGRNCLNGSTEGSASNILWRICPMEPGTNLLRYGDTLCPSTALISLS